MATSLRVGLLVVLLLGLGYWAYVKIEWVEIETDLGPTREARQDPYLAAKLFLEDLGVAYASVQHFRDFDQEDWVDIHPLDDTVLLVDAYGSLSEERARVLLDWVARGGRLVASASNPFVDDYSGVDDPLFEYFGVTVERRGEAGLDEELWQAMSAIGRLAGWSEENLCPMLSSQADFYFEEDEDHSVSAHFLSGDVLLAEADEPYAAVGNEEDSLMLQFEHGEGLVTFMVSLAMWRNWAIGCHDHAYILWQLVPGEEGVTFYINQDFPGLGSLIWKYFDLSLLVALILLAGWLWLRGSRFGPLRNDQASPPRQLMEHIDAGARFLWRMDQGDSLLRSSRAPVLAALDHRYPQSLELEGDARTEYLAKVLRLPAAQIELALWRDLQGDAAAFVDAMRLLQVIKEKL